MAGGTQRRLASWIDPDPEERVAAVMAAHGRALLAVAHRWSLCHDDALDAYQRALEIYLRRIDTVDVATEGAWLRVVVKHEALAIRRSRSGSVGHDDHDLADGGPQPPEHAGLADRRVTLGRGNRAHRRRVDVG